MTRLLTIALLGTFLSGCIISSRPRHHGHARESRAHGKKDCPPSYHMSGGVCVHNGNKGKHKHKGGWNK